MEYIKQQIEHDFNKTIREVFNLADIRISVRENQALTAYDYQVDCSFGLAKQLKKNPMEIAEAIIKNLGRREIYALIEPSKPGFINIKINQQFLQDYLNQLTHSLKLGVDIAAAPQTIVVDYASPNVAKEMHVGHLRSSIIGDAIARILTFLGHKIIKQNHIGDWGTQFGFLIEYIIEKKLTFTSISEVSKAYKEARELFDNNSEFALKSKQRLILLQAKDQYTYSIWQDLSKLSYQHFNQVFTQLGVLLTEGDARGESFYNFMLAPMVEGLIERNIAEESEGAKVIFLPGFYDKDQKPVPMIIQKSDGGFLYHTTDLAAAKYRIQELKANRIIYVTDARQKQHFEMLFAALKKADLVQDDSVRLNHIAFGTVLGEDKKPFKTRSGDTISLTLLLDEAESKAKEVVQAKHPEIDQASLSQISQAIGIGALKYADLSSDLTKDYVFSWDKMLSFNGNTAPYLQNAYVRIQSIFRKENVDLAIVKNYPILITNEAEHKLCLKLTEFPDVIASIEEKLTPHLLCNYLYELASIFHNFYENCPIGKCHEPEVKLSRLAICSIAANTLQTGLDLLGIKILDRM